MKISRKELWDLIEVASRDIVKPLPVRVIPFCDNFFKFSVEVGFSIEGVEILEIMDKNPEKWKEMVYEHIKKCITLC